MCSYFFFCSFILFVPALEGSSFNLYSRQQLKLFGLSEYTWPKASDYSKPCKMKRFKKININLLQERCLKTENRSKQSLFLLKNYSRGEVCQGNVKYDIKGADSNADL